MAELAEGARLLSECRGINLYLGFESRSLRHFILSFLHFFRDPASPAGSLFCSRKRAIILLLSLILEHPGKFEGNLKNAMAFLKLSSKWP
jgi:hypothetical protein